MVCVLLVLTYCLQYFGGHLSATLQQSWHLFLLLSVILPSTCTESLWWKLQSCKEATFSIESPITSFRSSKVSCQVRKQTFMTAVIRTQNSIVWKRTLCYDKSTGQNHMPGHYSTHLKGSEFKQILWGWRVTLQISHITMWYGSQSKITIGYILPVISI